MKTEEELKKELKKAYWNLFETLWVVTFRVSSIVIFFMSYSNGTVDGMLLAIFLLMVGGKRKVYV